MGTTKASFGRTLGGEDVGIFTLSFGPLEVRVCEYGATLVSLRLPPSPAGAADILLGFSSLEGYLGAHPYFGSTVGRVAGRIGGARFSLAGREYKLAANNGSAHLHGGLAGFEHRLWRGEAYEEGGEPRLRLYRKSPDGEEGYPANLEVWATFGLTAAQELVLGFEAATDAPTILTLTNHAYFNLAGEGRGTVADHLIQIHASRYLETDAGLVPTGKILDVTGSAYDLRSPVPIKNGIDALGGFDTFFVSDRKGKGLEECARVSEPTTGRSMVVSSSYPGLVFYTGNFLAGDPGKEGSRYVRNSGFCLETQDYPDAINHSAFPGVELMPGKEWKHESRYRFGFYG